MQSRHRKYCPLASAVACPSLLSLQFVAECRFAESQAAKAILLWPLLALFSQSFRREIREAALRQQHHMVRIVPSALTDKDCSSFPSHRCTLLYSLLICGRSCHPHGAHAKPLPLGVNCRALTCDLDACSDAHHPIVFALERSAWPTCRRMIMVRWPEERRCSRN